MRKVGVDRRPEDVKDVLLWIWWSMWDRYEMEHPGEVYTPSPQHERWRKICVTPERFPESFAHRGGGRHG